MVECLSPIFIAAISCASGVAVALPMLDSRPDQRAMAGCLPQTATEAQSSQQARRLVCIGNPYGMIPDDFFPHEIGFDYQTPLLLKPLEKHRRDFTLFSNLDHGYTGGHRIVDTFLTGIKTSDANAAPDGNISLDQRAAEFVGTQTRFPSLTLGVGGGCEMSWTRSGVNVPVIHSSRELFRMLFVDDSTSDKKSKALNNRRRSSILDSVNEQANSLSRQLGKQDQQKLDEYLTAVRDVEQKLAMSKHWIGKPKPNVEMREPADGGFVESLGVFYDLILLALQTDSTRVVSLEIPEGFNTTDLGLKNSYHGYSHHGKDEKNLAGLRVIEEFQTTQFSRFLDKLKSTQLASGQALFEKTMVLFGSGMGNGSSHSNKNLPILLAGGGFQHAGHLRLPSDKRERIPLSNLYVTMLQEFGIETDRFGNSSGTFDDFRRLASGAKS